MHQQFSSDNLAGICPTAWEAMAEARTGHAQPYGEDLWTSRSADAFRGCTTRTGGCSGERLSAGGRFNAMNQS
jgi:threonine aldolase